MQEEIIFNNAFHKQKNLVKPKEIIRFNLTTCAKIDAIFALTTG